MNRLSSLAALVIALLLHAGLIAIAVIGFPLRVDKSPEPVSIVVQLLPAQQETEAQPPVSPPTPLPPPPEQKPAEPKPKTVHKVSPKPVARPRLLRKPATPKIKAPPPVAATPEAPSAVPMPAVRLPAAAEAPSAPIAPAPPAKTGVYISAEYAATNRKPVYPSMSKRYGEQGTVVLRVLVKADGTAGQVEIKTSSGYPLLDDSARTAVQGWRFHPATRDGKPVDEWYLLRNTFTLQN